MVCRYLDNNYGYSNDSDEKYAEIVENIPP